MLQELVHEPCWAHVGGIESAVNGVFEIVKHQAEPAVVSAFGSVGVHYDVFTLRLSKAKCTARQVVFVQNDLEEREHVAQVTVEAGFTCIVASLHQR